MGWVYLISSDTNLEQGLYSYLRKGYFKIALLLGPLHSVPIRPNIGINSISPEQKSTDI